MSKPNFIILEGSDGSGKSTIAELLSKQLNYPIEHHGPVKSLEEGYNEYFNCVNNTNYSVVKDRFYFGEKVFAPLYRGYEADYFPKLEKALMEKFNVILVLVYAPFHVIEKRLEERGEDFVQPEHIRHCYDKVIEIFKDSSLPKVVIDTASTSVENNTTRIIRQLIKQNGL